MENDASVGVNPFPREEPHCKQTQDSLVKDGFISVLHDAAGSDEFIVVNTVDVLVVPDSLVECFNREEATSKEVIKASAKDDKAKRQWEIHDSSTDLLNSSTLNPIRGKESNLVIDYSGGEDVNSQLTICKNLHDLKVGFNRGRPRRKQMVVYNPFDFKLSTHVRNKMQSKQKSKGSQIINDINSKGVDDGLDTLNKNQRSFVVEATEIINATINMGLEVVGGRDEEIASLSKKLKA